MRKFLELARMTLKEDNVAIEDIALVDEFSTAAEKSTTPQSHSDFSNLGTLAQEPHETPRFRSPRRT
jgi:hypothetical protein